MYPHFIVFSLIKEHLHIYMFVLYITYANYIHAHTHIHIYIINWCIYEIYN